MKIKGDAIILAGGKFDSKSAKTAHGLLRGSNRFNIKQLLIQISKIIMCI